MAKVRTWGARISIDLQYSINTFLWVLQNSGCSIYLLSCLYRAGYERLARVLRLVIIVESKLQFYLSPFSWKKKKTINTIRATAKKGVRWIEVSNTALYLQIIRDFGKWPLNWGWPLNRGLTVHGNRAKSSLNKQVSRFRDNENCSCKAVMVLKLGVITDWFTRKCTTRQEEEWGIVLSATTPPTTHPSLRDHCVKTTNRKHDVKELHVFSGRILSCCFDRSFVNSWGIFLIYLKNRYFIVVVFFFFSLFHIKLSITCGIL